jgi:hypothetical protein
VRETGRSSLGARPDFGVRRGQSAAESVAFHEDVATWVAILRHTTLLHMLVTARSQSLVGLNFGPSIYCCKQTAVLLLFANILDLDYLEIIMMTFVPSR